MSDKYTTNTASLKATKIDARIIDAKKITKGGKPIVGQVYDIRGDRATEDDIWPNGAQIDAKGNVTVYPLGYNKVEISNGNDVGEKIYNSDVCKIINNTVYDLHDELIFFADTKAFVCDYESWYDDNGTFYNTRIESFNSDLSSLKNGNSMFMFCDMLSDFKGDLSSLENGSLMFSYCNSLESFTSSDLSSLKNGFGMFSYCNALAEFESDLSSLTDGSEMFADCFNLTTFTSDLSSLTKSYRMFNNCWELSTFNCNDLSSLNNGISMFMDCENLISFNCNDLSSLENGWGMFAGCEKLTKFDCDLSSLTNGEHMFGYDYVLENFAADLSSLVSGNYMFCQCKLNAQSVSNIIHTLPYHESTGSITIGIGINNNDDEKLAFAKECCCDSWQELLDEFSAKNWNVDMQCNGAPSSSYSLRQPQVDTSVYVKLEEVIMPTEEEGEKRKKKLQTKPHYGYTSIDGTKYYRLHWYHDTNGSTEGYEKFDSLEAACEHYGIISKTNN